MKFEALAGSFSQKPLPHSEIELAGEMPAEVVAQYREAALTDVAGQMELPGFRKGKVPKDMALKKVGEMGILEEAVELCMRDFYPELVEIKKLDVVGRPDIRITKMAPGNPVSLVIRVAVYPDIEIPKDWKKLAEKIPLEKAAEASEEEVNQTIESLRQSRAKPNDIVGTDGKPLPPALPEVNDEFAKSLGAFENVEALKAQIKKGIGEEKERAARDARRGKLIDALLEKTKVDIPHVFVESELEKMLSQMREDVSRFGMQFDEYLKRVGKTQEDIRKEYREAAEKRATLQLTLNKLAQDEKIEPEKEAVEHELHHALEHFPDANPELLRIHVETVLRNEKVLQALEGSPEEKKA